MQRSKSTVQGIRFIRMAALAEKSWDAETSGLVCGVRTAIPAQTASKEDDKRLKGRTMSRRKAVVWIAVATAAAATVIGVIVVRHFRPRWSVLQGAVIRRDADARKQTPISDVTVTATYGNSSVTTQSDASGYFRVEFPGTVLPGRIVKLSFSHESYLPLEIQDTISFRSSLRRLLVAEMTPLAAASAAETTGTPTVVQNIRIRYTVNSEREGNVGSEVKTFEVVNRGNVPCRRQHPCSPDGYWKASTGSITLDAGTGNEFRDARASCIAGPCPFTRIDSSGFSQGGRTITASAKDWSDTATFLLQAEVFHTSIISNVRESYPVVFGRGFNFTVPPTAEGVSLLAELKGAEIVFPLGPDLYLSWANCEVRNSPDAEKSAVYQCELKPEFRF
jgi:hypothetical protein